MVPVWFLPVFFGAGALYGIWAQRWSARRDARQVIKSGSDSVNIQCGRDLKL